MSSRLWRKRCAPVGCDSAFRRIAPSTGGGTTRGTEYASDVDDPRYAGLYGPAEPMHLPGDDTTGEPDPNHLERWLPPSQPYVDDWLARSTELVDDYHPDLIYFDWWINQTGVRAGF